MPDEDGFIAVLYGGGNEGEPKDDGGENDDAGRLESEQFKRGGDGRGSGRGRAGGRRNKKRS